MENTPVDMMTTEGKTAHSASPQAAEVQALREVEQPVPAGSSGDEKEQLKLRVETRVNELRQLLNAAGGHNTTTERGRSLVGLLNRAQSYISGGWERVGEKESAQLSEWLVSTASLKR